MIKEELKELKKTLEEIELFEDCISTRDTDEDVEEFKGYVKKCFELVEKVIEQDNTKVTPEELESKTEDFLNVICNGEKEEKFVELMSRGHRTLQQNYTRFVMRWIKSQSESKYFDGRNEASVNLCKKIMDAVKDDYSLPTI